MARMLVEARLGLAVRDAMFFFLEAMMGPTDAPAIHCSIDVEHQSGGVSLRGRVVSATETDGNYRLDIRLRSRSSSSNVSQAGQFHAKPNEPVFVGLANLSTGAGTRLVARLSVQAGDSRSCKAEREISDE